MNASIYYVLGDLVSKFIPFLILPYVTNSLGTEQYGELVFALSIISIVRVFANFGLDVNSGRVFFRYGKFVYENLVLIQILMTLPIFLVASVITSIIFLSDYWVVYLWSGFSHAVFNSVILKSQFNKQPKAFVMLQMLQMITTVIFTVFFIEFVESSAVSKIYANTLSFLLVIFLVLKGFKTKKLGFRVNKIIRYILYFGFPVFLNQLLIVAKTQFDRIYISHAFSYNELALYGLAAQLGTVLTLMLQAGYRGIMPKYYNDLKSGVVDKKMMLVFLSVTIFTVVSLSAISSFVPNSWYVYIFGQDFLELKWFIFWYIISTFYLPFQLLVNGYCYYNGLNGLVFKVNALIIPVYFYLIKLLSDINVVLTPLSIMISSLLGLVIIILCIKRIDK